MPVLIDDIFDAYEPVGLRVANPFALGVAGVNEVIEDALDLLATDIPVLRQFPERYFPVVWPRYYMGENADRV